LSDVVSVASALRPPLKWQRPPLLTFHFSRFTLCGVIPHSEFEGTSNLEHHLQ